MKLQLMFRTVATLTMSTIVFHTEHDGKFAEVKKILTPLGFDVLQMREDLEEIQGTPMQVILRKPGELKLCSPYDYHLFEDTSLILHNFLTDEERDLLDRYDNAVASTLPKMSQYIPGPYVKYFNNETLGKMLNGAETKRATAVCMMFVVEYKNMMRKSVQVFTGIANGTITAPRGSLGYGFDPVFQPDNCDKTFGEMTAEERQKVSQRTPAITNLADWLIGTKP